jgi:hypothetical protein
VPLVVKRPASPVFRQRQQVTVLATAGNFMFHLKSYLSRSGRSSLQLVKQMAAEVLDNQFIFTYYSYASASSHGPQII